MANVRYYNISTTEYEKLLKKAFPEDVFDVENLMMEIHQFNRWRMLGEDIQADLLWIQIEEQLVGFGFEKMKSYEHTYRYEDDFYIYVNTSGYIVLNTKMRDYYY